MCDEKDKKPKGLSAEDAELWAASTADVELMKGREYAPAIDDLEHDEPQSDEWGARETVIVSKSQAQPTKRGRSTEIDHRTSERLRRGKIPIEGTLDLHGLNQRDARDSLKAFIIHAYERKKRCVLVITGKGRSAPGVLRKNVPVWLFEDELAGIVLKSNSARPQHGGDGALYVYLRRQRD